jgi:ubiquitin-protein ligase E3 A
MLRYEELELLITGNPILDFAALRSGTRYDDGYTSSSETIHHFWVVVSEYNDEEKRAFLKFISGR